MKVTTQLKDIVSFSKGEQIKGSDLLEEGPYDYLNGGITPSGKWNRYNTPKNTVTVSEGGNSCGYVNYMDRPFWCGAHCYYLFNSKLDNKYLYYALKSQQNRLMKIRSGACMPNIKKSDLGAFKLTYETNELEQKEIVKRLDKVKLVIDLRKAELQQLDELVKSRFVELFGDCKNMVALNELCSVITDGTHQPPRFQNEGIPFIFVSNLANNTVTYNTEKFISEETYNELIKRTPIELGDILLSTVGSYGHPAVVVEERKFLFQRHIAYLKPKRSLVNSFYLHSALLAPDGQRQIEEKVKGIAQKTLNLSEIRKIMIPIPSIEEQNSFESFIKHTDKSKFCVTNHLKKIQLIKGELL